ncbi:low molecular weight protein-tyrosine-phosphatase [Rhizobium tubonense]|uniref:protein-tyrosine-phosphatase n=1 Tax=Rhizobium tubonense TaxID=484088 RepID=A0A2W4C9L0_9HYPH|nr:low molecular weight protein-tyrosine-phosphatase [Rhizobium tubonense]PZM09611.1 protein tyrosine phosphatase [Rhizobium tubonense]
MDRFQILFVCAGNICRSPLAEGIFRHMVINAGRAAEFNIGSAGTGSWHEGDAPDPRSISIATGHGIDISRQRARRVTTEDFDRFDLILAMDHDNLRNLQKVAPGEAIGKIHLFNSYAMGTDEDIPDPYYGDREDFETVYTMLLTGCSSLLAAAGKVRAS